MLLAHIYIWVKISIQALFLYAWFGKTAAFYERVLHLLRTENILFTKIFQSLANSSHEQIPPELRDQLRRYNANASYTDADINYEVLDEIEIEHGIQIDRTVINSGMIALVFKGIDASGTPVIVKLRRRGITESLRAGCRSITDLYNTVAQWYPQNIYIRILRPFIRNIDDIIDQCNFSREIANLKTAKEDFIPLTFIQIPTVYNRPDQTNQTNQTEYILMEYIDGVHTLPPSTPHDVRLKYMEQYFICFFFALIANTIHNTDLHSGNIIFTESGIGMIDYGMAVQLNDEWHDAMLSIAELVREKRPVHEIDFIETFKGIFEPPLNKAEIQNVRVVEELCADILQPMLDNMEQDELKVTDNLMLISQELGRSVELNRNMYALILGYSMMSGQNVIMGLNHPYKDTIRELQDRAMDKAFMLVMS
jgi:predicted unusual protein kinase regulating ubiquinone biosynthesis (AarF/ABC1/UbiB family)